MAGGSCPKGRPQVRRRVVGVGEGIAPQDEGGDTGSMEAIDDASGLLGPP